MRKPNSNTKTNTSPYQTSPSQPSPSLFIFVSRQKGMARIQKRTEEPKTLEIYICCKTLKPFKRLPICTLRLRHFQNPTHRFNATHYHKYYQDLRVSSMALEQALALSPSPATNLYFSISNPPLTNTKTPALSLNPLTSSSKRSHFQRSLKCSADYRDNQYSQAVTHAKPAEIQWNKDLCNSVHLIGIVGTPVEIKHLPSGKVVAWTRLAVKKSANDTSW